MTKVAARFAAPWGHHDPQKLREDLVEAQIDFSQTRYDGRTDLPSCMDVWVDNIMCDSMSCKSKCWLKFFNAKNAKTEITGRVPWYDLNAQCPELTGHSHGDQAFSGRHSMYAVFHYIAVVDRQEESALIKIRYSYIYIYYYFIQLHSWSSIQILVFPFEVSAVTSSTAGLRSSR
ncbi:unnamed protein product [Durusdinium trenchii]|uniref:Uncharacterized protein n=1 Tax=Durusdinium trenchii TaxID=1381693 RepID=A0ABP0IX84_9DINO